MRVFIKKKVNIEVVLPNTTSDCPKKKIQKMSLHTQLCIRQKKNAAY